MKPRIMVLIPLPAPALQTLAEHYELLVQPDSQGSPRLQEHDAALIAGIVTNGTTGCSGEWMQRLPALKIICAWGAGYEGIDVAAARQRSITVTHAPGTNSETVADHAIALALAIARDICARDAAVHAGNWATSRSARPTLNGACVGIIGMGRIGGMVAVRAQAFGARIAFFNPRPVDAAPGTPYPSVAELAAASDFLIATCPGGPATYHIVNAEVFQALGPSGFLVNVARGSVVDTLGLIDALHHRQIAGAALDVFEDEPVAPPALLKAPNLIITPHMAGRSPASQKAQTEVLLRNIDAALGGHACPNAIRG